MRRHAVHLQPMVLTQSSRRNRNRHNTSGFVTHTARIFYIPGTETCLRIHGYVRYLMQGGDDVYGRGFTDKDDTPHLQRNSKRDSWDNSARFTLRASTASETELGTLKPMRKPVFSGAMARIPAPPARCALHISIWRDCVSASIFRRSYPSWGISATSLTMM